MMKHYDAAVIGGGILGCFTARNLRKWNISTCILYGGKDDLQSGEVMKAFAERFNCNITIAENSEHPFMTEEDGQIVKQWLWENI